MSNLDAAMIDHIYYIVTQENRPFSYRDFAYFVVDGIEHKMTHGTFRNKVSTMIKEGTVEFSYRDIEAFYTVPRYPFTKSMTGNHTVVSGANISNSKTANDIFYKLIKNLPLDKQSIHDVRLRFEVPDIDIDLWKIVSTYANYPKNKKSLDIAIPSYKIDKVIVRILIHKTNTVSIILGCTLYPIVFDINGFIRLFEILARTEMMLKFIIANCIMLSNSNSNSNSTNTCVIIPFTDNHIVPNYKQWTVTMWHFGRDSLTEYSGQKFSRTIEEFQNIVTRIYSKEFGNGKTRIRIERQEYPNKSVSEAIEEKLNEDISLI